MKIDLKVPYLSQLDNLIAPGGTCNVTSVAMVMRYYGLVGDGQGQLEDQLSRKCQAEGWDRHSPFDLARLFFWKGIEDKFDHLASWARARAHLETKNPLVCHGYFTRFGHIIVIRGFDDSAYSGRGAFIVNDPAGEWSEHGYLHHPGAGEGALYSYAMMNRLAAPDGQLWLHFPSKRK